MMSINLVLYLLCMLCMATCIFLGTHNYSKIERSIRVFYLLIIISFTGEVIALISEYGTGSNTQVYNIMDIILTTITLIYFAGSLGRPLLCLFLAIVSVSFGIYNFIWLQPDEHIKNYFLLWSGLAIIGLSLFMLVHLYKMDTQIKLFHFAHFWLTSALLLYWTINLLHLQVFKYFTGLNPSYATALNIMHLLSNIFSYGVTGIVFHKISELKQ